MKKKEKAAEAPSPEPLRFEEALAGLEETVAVLEGGEPPLEEALAAYEKGVALVKRCQQLLDQAEQRVNQLTGVGPAGEAQTKPFDAS